MSQLFQQRQLRCLAPGAGAAGRVPQRGGAPLGRGAAAAWRTARRTKQPLPAVLAAAEVKDEERSLYSAQEDPITRFGFWQGFGDRYEVQEKIGSGTFGVVHVAVDKQTGER